MSYTPDEQKLYHSTRDVFNEAADDVLAVVNARLAAGPTAWSREHLQELRDARNAIEDAKAFLNENAHWID